MHELVEPYASHLPSLLAAALAEDLPDLTGPAVFGPDETLAAALVVKAPGVVAGAPAFAAAFAFLDGRCRVEALRGDGDAVRPGDEAALVSGPARAVLAAERTALNFVTRLSGVATLTRRFVDAVAGTDCKVLDTRKTTPGWRALEKHAVRCGGGTNHRMGLFDAAMLKDTHLAAAGSITAAVSRVRDRWGAGVPLVVECADLAMVEEALACKVEHIMLDNMDLAAVRGAVAFVAGRARLEVSGGVTLENVRGFAETGVDFASVGALTHSAPALDLSLKVRP
ncbi:MAG: carboxylating nicotinate-nucleotide diphosphorylase [Acidobacteria bacterium]|nr:MAG: carboxylating nicotinate-nucleotide diphosphorylase [Acidobacteriota bacterium]